MSTDTMIDVLRAPGAHPDLTDRLMLFGQFVGAWEVTVSTYGMDGATTRVPGEWHFDWALEGRAVMDYSLPRVARRGTRRGAGPMASVSLDRTTRGRRRPLHRTTKRGRDYPRTQVRRRGPRSLDLLAPHGDAFPLVGHKIHRRWNDMGHRAGDGCAPSPVSQHR